MFGYGRYLTSDDWEEIWREFLARRARRLNSAGNGIGRVNTVTDEEANSSNPALRPTYEKVEDSQLKPEKIDYQVQANGKNHHTDDYDEDVFGLVVRRGQTFEVVVTFDRAYDPEKDQLILQLTFGVRPNESKNTLIRVKESKEVKNSSWGFRIDSISGRNVNLTIMSPANALVGEYKVFVETKTKKSGEENEYLTFKKQPGKEDTIIALFNAWCEEDAVYMEVEADRKEYVLNTRGKIWVGNKYRSSGRSWNFGQFEEVSLKTCLLVLDKCQNLKTTSRGDPVMVTRFLTKMVNATDDDGGILVGNWSGEYAPHTSPIAWTGSVKILEEYLKLKNKKEGVKFGQCWVFSGLLTTLGRAIGIPTRSVTNFESAHDTDASATIDYHFCDGKPIKGLNRDSVWNFHVWNECFFKRQDLPSEMYNGWQAIDATPQEESQGIYCCGPSPLKAIKEGMVYIPYDTRFLFGEVNGDRVNWELNVETGEMTVRSIDEYSVGKKISTKAVGNDECNIVTNYYKHKEGSAPERSAAHRAYNMSSRRDNKIYDTKKVNDVIFDFVNPDPELMIGADVDLKLKMKNTSKDLRTINVSIITMMAFYTGITAIDLDELENEIYKLQPEEENVVSFQVPSSQYIGRAPPETNIKAYLSAKVKETQQAFHDIEVVELRKPNILFEYKNEEVIEKKKFEMTLHFKNPLTVQLENCVFNIETSRHVSPDTITKELQSPVKPQESASITVTLEPKIAGWRYISAKFSSDQLTGVDGEELFKVN